MYNTLACPLRCESGFDGCNDCICDGLGNSISCGTMDCGNGRTAATCSKCEIGYYLNTITNTCDSGTVRFNCCLFFASFCITNLL